MKTPNYFISFGLFLGSCCLAGCGVNGTAYAPVTPPPGKGVVYVYRKPSFVGCVAEGMLRANGVPVTILSNGGYFPYVGPPGDTLFTSKIDWNRRATVRVQHGKAKYLKAEFGGPTARVLELTEVSPSVGQSEITECKLLDPISR